MADLGPAVAKDPLVSIKIKGAKSGDKIKINWSDNNGESGSEEAAIGQPEMTTTGEQMVPIEVQEAYEGR